LPSCKAFSPKILIFKLKSETMAKQKTAYTSRTVASKAARLMNNPKSTREVKSVAASALMQARNKRRKESRL
jgi:hypothetical protein